MGGQRAIQYFCFQFLLQFRCLLFAFKFELLFVQWKLQCSHKQNPLRHLKGHQLEECALLQCYFCTCFASFFSCTLYLQTKIYGFFQNSQTSVHLPAILMLEKQHDGLQSTKNISYRTHGSSFNIPPIISFCCSFFSSFSSFFGT